MRSSFALSLLVLALAACGDGALGSGDCSDHHDSASCKGNPLCHVVGCAPCGGEPSFGGCYPIGENPPIACPAIACLACNTLTDRAQCDANPSCESVVCEACGGVSFQGCYDKGTGPAPVCPLSCPACIGNAEGECAGSPGCHAVYKDPASCGCSSPGCCQQFDHCAYGQAVCSIDPAKPVCDTPDPSCDPGYSVGYNNNCAEGCVKADQCS
jgi:hypothetical protein